MPAGCQQLSQAGQKGNRGSLSRQPRGELCIDPEASAWEGSAQTVWQLLDLWAAGPSGLSTLGCHHSNARVHLAR